MGYGMYTDVGDDEVGSQISNVMERLKKENKLPRSDDETAISNIVDEIMDLVCKAGEGRVNECINNDFDIQSKAEEAVDEEEYEDDEEDYYDYYDDMKVVEGFNEVHDTVVRENIYERVWEYLEEYHTQDFPVV